MPFLQWLRNFGGDAVLTVILMLPASAAHAELTELRDHHISLSINRSKITVSGISSGAAMAQQIHMAHSNDIAGIGMVAAPPFRCADYLLNNPLGFALDRPSVATTLCTHYFDKLGFSRPKDLLWSFPINLERLLNLTDEARLSGNADPQAGLCGDRVFLIAGGRDDTVPANVTQTTEALYTKLLDDSVCHEQPNIESHPDRSRYPGDRNLEDMPHTMPTDSSAEVRNCVSGPPYIADCDYAGAENILKFLYPMNNETPGPALERNLITFDQHRIIGTFEPKWMMHKNGHIYVPEACQHDQTCSLHVAFHGCHQNEDQINEGIGDASRNYRFAADAGYNEFAERNQIVVLYPQVANDERFPFGRNPNGCWDWWSYTGDPVYYGKNGGQIKVVWKIIEEVMR
jgi:hypothetical protein